MLGIFYCPQLMRVVSLPRLRPRGSPENIDRVHMMAAANHQWRVARMADGKRQKHEAGCHLCKMRVNWRWPKGNA